MRKCSHPKNRLRLAGDEVHCKCGRVIVGKAIPAEAFKNMAALFQSGYRGPFSLATGKSVTLTAK